jgi:spore coat polysaccharide biosynthesis predicted glycosyltransferase SpsG
VQTSGLALVIRADGSQQPGGMGIGHLMRCLSLATTWQQYEGVAVLVTASISDYALKLFSSVGISINHLPSDVQPGTNPDGEQTSAIASALNAPWVVVDGYQFGLDFNHEVHPNHHLMVVDDFAQTTSEPLCSALLDQNIQSGTSMYQVNDACVTMFGPQYALLPPNSQRGELRSIIASVRKVLLILGGAPSPGVQTLVMQAALALSREDFDVTVAGGPRLDLIPGDFRWVGTTPNLAGLIREADIVIAAAGSVCWLVCYSGVPLLSFSVAVNQVPLAKNLSELGVAIDLGWWEDLTAQAIVENTRMLESNMTKREGMSRRGYSLVDGRGAHYVLDQIMTAVGIQLESPS